MKVRLNYYMKLNLKGEHIFTSMACTKTNFDAEA